MFLRVKILPLALILTLLVFLNGADVEASTDYFSSKAVPHVVAVGLTSWPARSVTDCALLVSKSAVNTGRAFTFVAATKTCVASATWNADFSTAAPGSEVFRQPVIESYPGDVFAQIGSRTFRVIQQRSKGDLSFARNWANYENGFGDGTDFWLGLKTISNLTSSTPRVFRMEAVTWAGVFYFSEYSGFTVGGASTYYTMTFSAFLTGSSNTSSDSLTYHKGARFLTTDNNGGNSCPANSEGGGGWWYKSCADSNPSGIYWSSAVSNGEANMHWRGADSRNALKSIRLMLEM